MLLNIQPGLRFSRITNGTKLKTHNTSGKISLLMEKLKVVIDMTFWMLRKRLNLKLWIKVLAFYFYTLPIKTFHLKLCTRTCPFREGYVTWFKTSTIWSYCDLKTKCVYLLIDVTLSLNVSLLLYLLIAINKI